MPGPCRRSRAGTIPVREDAGLREPPRIVCRGTRPCRRTLGKLPSGVHSSRLDQRRPLPRPGPFRSRRRRLTPSMVPTIGYCAARCKRAAARARPISGRSAPSSGPSSSPRQGKPQRLVQRAAGSPGFGLQRGNPHAPDGIVPGFGGSRSSAIRRKSSSPSITGGTIEPAITPTSREPRSADLYCHARHARTPPSRRLAAAPRPPHRAAVLAPPVQGKNCRMSNARRSPREMRQIESATSASIATGAGSSEEPRRAKYEVRVGLDASWRSSARKTSLCAGQPASFTSVSSGICAKAKRRAAARAPRAIELHAGVRDVILAADDVGDADSRSSTAEAKYRWVPSARIATGSETAAA